MCSLKANDTFYEHQMEIKMENDYDMHEQAGLIYSGIDDDGDDLWMGSSKQFKKYEELLNNLNK